MSHPKRTKIIGPSSSSLLSPLTSVRKQQCSRPSRPHRKKKKKKKYRAINCLPKIVNIRGNPESIGRTELLFFNGEFISFTETHVRSPLWNHSSIQWFQANQSSLPEKFCFPMIIKGFSFFCQFPRDTNDDCPFFLSSPLFSLSLFSFKQINYKRLFV